MFSFCHAEWDLPHVFFTLSQVAVKQPPSRLVPHPCNSSNNVLPLSEAKTNKAVTNIELGWLGHSWVVVYTMFHGFSICSIIAWKHNESDCHVPYWCQDRGVGFHNSNRCMQAQRLERRWFMWNMSKKSWQREETPWLVLARLKCQLGHENQT